MSGCAILGCNSYLRGRAVTLHPLPTDPVVASQWIEVIKRSRGDLPLEDDKKMSVCSDHFAYKDMCGAKNKLIKRKLVPGAVPCKVDISIEDIEEEVCSGVKFELLEPENGDPLSAPESVHIPKVQDVDDDIVNKLVSCKKRVRKIKPVVSKPKPVVSKPKLGVSKTRLGAAELQKEFESLKQSYAVKKREVRLLQQRLRRSNMRYASLKRLTQGLVNVLKQLKRNDELDSYE